jgi:cytochrome c-type biogenesis protein CcmH/NrfF
MFGPQLRTNNRIRKLWSILAISTVLMLSTAARDPRSARFNDLGHRMMCNCGCDQVLLECNHTRFALGPCENAIRMRSELKAALQKNDRDEVILSSLVQKYGATVLAVQNAKRVDIGQKMVWIVAFAMLASTAALLIVFVRKRRPGIVLTAPMSELDDIEMDALRRRVRDETKNDNW